MYLPTLISLFSSLALVRNFQGDEEDVRLIRDRAAQRKVLARILCQGLRQMQIKENMVQRGGFITEVALGI
jgi:hypothetical protein